MSLRALYNTLQSTGNLAEQLGASELAPKWRVSLFGDPNQFQIVSLEKSERAPLPSSSATTEDDAAPASSKGKKRRREHTPRRLDQLSPPPESFVVLHGTIRSADSGVVTSVSGLFETPDLDSVTVNAVSTATGLHLKAFFWFTNRIQVAVEVSNFSEDPASAIAALAGEDVQVEQLSILTLSDVVVILATAPYQRQTALSVLGIQRGISFWCQVRLPVTITACFVSPPGAFDLLGLVDVIEDGPRLFLQLQTYPPVALNLGAHASLTACWCGITVAEVPLSATELPPNDFNADERDGTPDASGEPDREIRIALVGKVPGLDAKCSPSGELWQMWSDVPVNGDLYAFRLAIPTTNPSLDDLGLVAPFIPGLTNWLPALPDSVRQAIRAFQIVESVSIFNARSQILTSSTFAITVSNVIHVGILRTGGRGETIDLALDNLQLKWLVGLPESVAPQVALEGVATINVFGADLHGEIQYVPRLAYSAHVARADTSPTWVRGVIEELGLELDRSRSVSLTAVEDVIFRVDAENIELILVGPGGETETHTAPR